MSMERRKRRLWDDDEKCRIVAQTRVPGVSVSQVARRYDVNANLVFKWLRDPRFKATSVDDPAASYFPVEVVAAPPIIDPPVIEPMVSEAKIEILLSNGHRGRGRSAADCPWHPRRPASKTLSPDVS